MAIITETLRPESIVSIHNFSPNNIAYIQDSPTAPDANNIATTGVTGGNPTLEVKFSAPSGVFSGTQTINVNIVDPSWIGAHIEVLEGGTIKFTSAVKYAGAGSNQAFTFDASVLADKTGANTTIRVVAHVYSGSTIQSVRAMNWVASVDNAGGGPPPDTTPPGEITNLTEKHTDMAIVFEWINPTDADYKWVQAYKDGVLFADTLNFHTLTDTAVLPSTTYHYRFTTVDKLGNESNGVEITVTTDEQHTYEKLKPIAITNISNLSPNDVTYIDDDPDFKDDLVLTPPATLTGEPTVRVKFETPSKPISGLQTIKWVFNDPNYYGTNCFIYENGVEILRSPSPHYAINGVKPVVFIFDASLISDKTLATVEVEIRAIRINSNTISNFGAIEWATVLQQVEVPINGSISGISGASASLTITKAHVLTGTIVVTSGISADLFTAKAYVLSGEIAAHSAVSAELSRNFELNGSINAVSGATAYLTDVQANHVLSGVITAVSSATAELTDIQANHVLTGTISAVSGALAELTDIQAHHDLSGIVLAVSGASAELTDVQANHVLIGTISAVSNVGVEVLNKSFSIDGSVSAASGSDTVITINRDLGGMVEARSDVLQTQLQKIFEINGAIAGSSAFDGSLSKLTAIEGQIQSFSDGSGFLGRTILLQGSVIAISSVMIANLPVLHGLNSEISINSDVTGHLDLQGQAALTGSVTTQSSLTANLSKMMKFSGNILGVSTLKVNYINLVKPINGHLAAFSDAFGTISKELGIDGSIIAISSMSGSMSVLIGETFLSGEIVGMSSLYGELDRFLELSGSIDAVSDLLSDLYVGGQQFDLDGTIFAVSGAEVRPPINLFLEVDDAGYDGVEILNDGLRLSHTIDEGLGRHIQFEFEFIVDPTFLEKIEFRVKGTPRQPFYLRAWNYGSNRWDKTNQAVYDGQLDAFVSMVIRDFDRYLGAENKVRIAMKSVKGYTSGTLTLSTDYAELRKSYFQ
ncbi:hypothetical protein ACSU64_28005 [Bacillaceae bacterium C204]|uniref:hypothetical protein n=1 Tax=Neobacillus sp. 204 TaxID=3383351 RepID=UPI00397BF13A